jgi:hypothetical protein
MDTFLFPSEFTSDFSDKNEPLSGGYVLNRLWKNANVELSFEVDENSLFFKMNQTSEEISTIVDGQKFLLPKEIPESDFCPNVLVPYFQEVLDLNKIEKIIFLNHQEEKNFTFEVLDEKDFRERIEYPIEEYRANMNSIDGIPIAHPNIPYTWIWVAPRIGKIFPYGEGDDFDESSICYKSWYE